MVLALALICFCWAACRPFHQYINDLSPRFHAFGGPQKPPSPQSNHPSVFFFLAKKANPHAYDSHLKQLKFLISPPRRRGDSVAAYGRAAHPLGDRGDLCIVQHGLHNWEKPGLHSFLCAV
jgi:hypothetical protein